ncbi:hypothetical protein J4481_01095 [Candidatus Pacearchaeota archaeon]|nr:hypothetical protein [uncultured archaeon]MBS3076320.1 hypothetical protein [Candidatus Pacearchaeota archaeon]
MKTKLSISIDEEKVTILDEMLKNHKFRNKSHLIEVAIGKLLEQEKNE